MPDISGNIRRGEVRRAGGSETRPERDAAGARRGRSETRPERDAAGADRRETRRGALTGERDATGAPRPNPVRLATKSHMARNAALAGTSGSAMISVRAALTHES